MNTLYADIIVDISHEKLDRTFQYRVPESLRGRLEPGACVMIPFGNGNRLIKGYVVALGETCQFAPEKIKDIAGMPEKETGVEDKMIALAAWIRRNYGCTMIQALKTVLPAKQSVKKLEHRQLVRLMNREEILSLLGECERKKQVAKARLLKALSEQETIPYEWITGKLGVSAATVNSIVKSGAAKLVSSESYRNPVKMQSVEAVRNTLSEEQQTIVTEVFADFDAGRRQTYLIHGITGSGKTEVYLRLTERALADGGQVLVLVPEIALTGQTVKRFKAWFGGAVAVAHSRLSASERADVWQKMRSGQARVLIGVRSAVFCPFSNLSLIILDEEHEGSYKQEERPSYHARLVAQYRAHYRKLPVVLGSATPDLESYYLAETGVYTHLYLRHRAREGAHLPQVSIVDMREELQKGNRTVLSEALRSRLEETVQHGEQAIILLNRRGYSTFVMCRDCGESISCPNCAVSLVYHAREQLLECHYCGHTEPVPTVCPHCGSKRIKFFGTGTEKAETEIQGLCPGVKPLRMDQDSTSRKFAHERILSEFRSGAYNVLLGTQMVAKGHDIPNVTLVGILSADSQLNLPDFRSGERCFALLTQAAGRAGRGDKPGHVIFQAYDAENPILQLAARQDYEGFAKLELAQRKELGYPPFTRMLKVTVLHKNQEEALATAQKLVNALEAWQLETKQPLEILGPFPAIVARVNQIYRINVLLKSPQLKPVKDWLRQSDFRALPNVLFDVDPMSVV